MQWPLCPYYGAKFKVARILGPPRYYKRVVEPLGGFGSFSCLHEPTEVFIVEKNPVVIGVLHFLKGASQDEIMALPTNISHLDELPPWVCEEARNLIGFHLNRFLAAPALSRSNWARNPNYAAFYWSETTKCRLASNVDRIRHWNITWGSYEEAPDIEAHWFIDPPYSNDAGRAYPYHDIDYAALAKWCKSRRGFVQVCGNDGETWLPFRPLTIVSSHRARGYSVEAICEFDNRPRRRSR